MSLLEPSCEGERLREKRFKNMNPINILLNAIQYLNESYFRDENDLESVEILWRVLREL
jgi:hypothetical protein